MKSNKIIIWRDDMNNLFTQGTMGRMELKNRSIQAAILEVMAGEDGRVSDRFIERYERLARGEVALAITGGMFVNENGRVNRYQAGIHNDAMIPDLKRLTDAVHKEGGKIAFQIMHGGIMSTKELTGHEPLDLSEMNEEQINKAIIYFSEAAKRAVQSGADAIELHAAHGALLSQFISPFFNKRNDDWGGCDENRFRFLKEVIIDSKKAVPENFPIIVKMNYNDYTPEDGITPELAIKYAVWLNDLGVHGLEVSSGTLQYSFMNMSRGEVPVDEMVMNLQEPEKNNQREILESIAGKYNMEESYNLDAAKAIKNISGDMKIILVGGNRTLQKMNEIIDSGYSDFIAIGRPLVMEPGWVKKASEGKACTMSCKSCNKCLAAVTNDMPLRCYVKGISA